MTLEQQQILHALNNNRTIESFAEFIRPVEPMLLSDSLYEQYVNLVRVDASQLTPEQAMLRTINIYQTFARIIRGEEYV